MRARAPGKLVLSGAYAVLEGAPAIVTAVDRYVIADASREADFVTPEVRCAIGSAPAPWFDASELRRDGRKIGLGSSAAIVVASLAARALREQPELDDAALADRVFALALRGHREAQGGGSGIDVITSAHGATRVCWLDAGGAVRSRAQVLPPGLRIDVYATDREASTRDMLARVRAFARSDHEAYAARIARLTDAARRAASGGTVESFVGALRDQVSELASMGDAAGAPIVPEELRDEVEGVAVIPSGAGGGDVVLCAGEPAACDACQSLLEGRGMQRLDIALGARGVHAAA